MCFQWLMYFFSRKVHFLLIFPNYQFTVEMSVRKGARAEPLIFSISQSNSQFPQSKIKSTKRSTPVLNFSKYETVLKKVRFDGLWFSYLSHPPLLSFHRALCKTQPRNLEIHQPLLSLLVPSLNVHIHKILYLFHRINVPLALIHLILLMQTPSLHPSVCTIFSVMCYLPPET